MSSYSNYVKKIDSDKKAVLPRALKSVCMCFSMCVSLCLCLFVFVGALESVCVCLCLYLVPLKVFVCVSACVCLLLACSLLRRYEDKQKLNSASLKVSKSAAPPRQKDFHRREIGELKFTENIRKTKIGEENFVNTMVRRQNQVDCLKVSESAAPPRQTAFHKNYTEYKKC